MQVDRGDEEVLDRSGELGGTEWGDVGRRGDGEELNRSGELWWIDGDELSSLVELDGVGKLLEVNDEAGRAESTSTTGVVEVGERRTGKHFPQTLHAGTQRFF